MDTKRLENTPRERSPGLAFARSGSSYHFSLLDNRLSEDENYVLFVDNMEEENKKQAVFLCLS